MEHDSLPFVTRSMLGGQFRHGTAFQLRIRAWADTTTEVEIVGFTREGPFKFAFKHSGDRTVESFNLGIPDIPIMVTARVDSNSILRGQLFVKINLGINEDTMVDLAQGYVTRMSNPSWPHGLWEDNLSGRGLFKTVAISDPAAGAVFTHTVPTNTAQKIYLGRFKLVTDANVANREIRWKFTDGTNDLGRILYNGQTAESLTKNFSAQQQGGEGDDARSDELVCSLPEDMLFTEGMEIGLEILNIQATDQLSLIFLYVEQWLTP